MEIKKSLRELAEYTGAELCPLSAGDIEISRVSALDQADSCSLSFLANPKYRLHLETTQAAAVVLSKEVPFSRPCLRSSNPYLDFMKIVSLFAPPIPKPAPGIHPQAYVHPEACLAEEVAIGPFCVVNRGVRLGKKTVLVAQIFVGENTQLGEECLVYPQVTIRERVSIGNKVIIQPGAVIGADGFGFAPDDGKKYRKIPQIGTVVIEDEVEIGANTTIDRATLGETRVGRGTKLDNLIQLAHNVTVGENTVMAAQVGISGSTRIGKRVMVGGQAGASGHLEIGDDAILGAKAGVTRNVRAKEFVSGYPARPHKEALRVLAETGRLPELRKKLEELAEKIRVLEQKNGG